MPTLNIKLNWYWVLVSNAMITNSCSCSWTSPWCQQQQQPGSSTDGRVCRTVEPRRVCVLYSGTAAHEQTSLHSPPAQTMHAAYHIIIIIIIIIITTCSMSSTVCHTHLLLHLFLKRHSSWTNGADRQTGRCAFCHTTRQLYWSAREIAYVAS